MNTDDCRITRLDAGGYRVEFDERYATDPADLWQAITVPERLARWMAPYRGEFAVGGKWEALGSTGDVWCTGTVESCDAPHGFTTTWHVNGEPVTRLVVRLVPDGDGTRLILRHDGITDVEYGPGWHVYLEALAQWLGTRAPTRDDVWWDARFAEVAPMYAGRFEQA